MIFWYKLARHQKRAETSKLELKMKFLFAANCNLQQILSAFLEIENACAHNFTVIQMENYATEIVEDLK